MKERYSSLTKDILWTLFITGAIIVAATSPYFLLNIVKQIYRNRKYLKKDFEERKVKKAFEKLRKNRLIILREKNGKFIVELTEKGKRKVKEIQFENLKIEKPEVWDRKWWIIIFDIPNKHNRARDALREKIKKLNFYPLQKSVWVYPYSCEKEVQFLCEFFNISPYVNIVVAESIANDVKLRKYFKLL